MTTTTVIDGLTPLPGFYPTVAADSPEKPDSAVEEMSRRWVLPDALLGGTIRMRAEAQWWLPPFEAEDNRDWLRRVKQSFLFGAYEEALRRCVGPPFAVAVRVLGEEDLDAPLASIRRSTDPDGRDLTAFAQTLTRSAIHRGLAHVLVTFSTRGGEVSRADEIAGLVRPRFVLVRAEDLLGWKTTTRQDAGADLAEVRIGSWATRDGADVRRVTVMTAPTATDQQLVEDFRALRLGAHAFVAAGGTLGAWTIFERPADKPNEAMVEVETHEHTYPGVPLLTLYTRQDGYLVGRPALESLAWANLEHFQSSSDQRNILSVARVPVPFGAGFQAEDNDIVVGSRKLVTNPNPDAKLSFVGAPSQPIELGFRDMERIEAQMEVLGQTPFMQRRANVTATGQVLAETKERAEVQMWLLDAEYVLTEAYRVGLRWMASDRGGGDPQLPEGVRVLVHKDFPSPADAGDIGLLSGMTARRQLSRRTLLEETIRRGKIRRDLDVTEELDRIDREPMGFGAFDAGGTNGAS